MAARSKSHSGQNDAGQQDLRAASQKVCVTYVESVPAWEEALAHHLSVEKIIAFADEPFSGRLRARVLDVARLLHLDVSPHRLQSCPPDPDPDPAYLYVLPVRGSVRASQQTHGAAVESGRFVVLDTAVPYELVFESDGSVIVIRVPREVVGIPPILLRRITGMSIGVDGGLIDAVMPLLVRLAEDLVVHGRHSSVRLMHNLTDLLTTVLLEHLATLVPGGSRQGLVLEITAYLHEHLGEPELSAETVASAHYISPRYLRKLFQEQQTKVSEWIRLRRLESCRRQLVDPLLADEPISSIAARWGFSDPAHFSRLFKSTYGRSPRQFRTEGLGQDRPDGPADGE